MIVSLMKTQKQSDTDTKIDAEEDSFVDVHPPDANDADDSLTETYGRLDLEPSSTRYVGSTYWTAVLDDVCPCASLFDKFLD